MAVLLALTALGYLGYRETPSSVEGNAAIEIGAHFTCHSPPQKETRQSAAFVRSCLGEFVEAQPSASGLKRGL